MNSSGFIIVSYSLLEYSRAYIGFSPYLGKPMQVLPKQRRKAVLQGTCRQPATIDCFITLGWVCC